MRITADTNLLQRAIVGDDPRQSEAAREVLGRAELIAVPPIVLCELVSTLRRRAGGDFAGGVIDSQGAAMAGGSLATFDQDAVSVLGAAGLSAAEPQTVLANH